MLAPSDASRNRTLPGWQRWMLAPSDASIGTGRYQVSSDGWPHRMLLGTGRYQVGSDGWPHRMLLGTGRYQDGSDGCWPHRMLLGTGRYQVSSDGCSPHRMRMLLRWPAMDARPIACSSKRTSLRRPGGNADCCLSPTPTPAARTSSNLYTLVQPYICPKWMFRPYICPKWMFRPRPLTVT